MNPILKKRSNSLSMHKVITSIFDLSETRWAMLWITVENIYNKQEKNKFGFPIGSHRFYKQDFCKAS